MAEFAYRTVGGILLLVIALTTGSIVYLESAGGTYKNCLGGWSFDENTGKYVCPGRVTSFNSPSCDDKTSSCYCFSVSGARCYLGIPRSNVGSTISVLNNKLNFTYSNQESLIGVSSIVSGSKYNVESLLSWENSLVRNGHKWGVNISIPTGLAGSLFAANLEEIIFNVTVPDKELDFNRIQHGFSYIESCETTPLRETCQHVDFDFRDIRDFLSNLSETNIGSTIERDGNNVLVKFNLSIFTFLPGETIFLDPQITINNVSSYASDTTNVTTEPSPLAHITVNDTELILYMPFDLNRSSGETTHDYSTHNNDGSLGGDSVINDSGFIGGGFNPARTSNSFITLPSTLAGGDGATLSATAWVYPAAGLTSGQRHTIFHTSHTGSSSEVLRFQIDHNNYLRIDNDFGVGALGINNCAITYDAWNHVGVIIDFPNGIAMAFVDGVNCHNDTSITDSSGALAAQNFVGTRTGGTANYNGVIDELMVWNRSISSLEITQIYQNSTMRYQSPPATQLFDFTSILQNGSINRLNITSNSTQNGGTSMQLRVQGFDTNNVSVENTTWQTLPAGDEQNLTFNISTDVINVRLEYNYTPDNNRFHTPFLRDDVLIFSFSVPDDADTTIPNVTIDSPLNVTYDQANVSFNATVLEDNPADGILQITPDLGPTVNYTLTNVSGNWGYTNLSMPNDTYTAQFFINDTSGNTNLTENVTFTIAVAAPSDSEPPSVTIDSPANTTFEARAIVNFNATVLEDNPDTGLVQLTRDGDTGINYTLTNNSGNWGYTNTSITLGTYTAEFYFNDTSGNVNNTESVVFTVADTTIPNVTINSPANTTSEARASITFNITVLELFADTGTVQLTRDGDSAINYSLTNNSGNWELTNSSITIGTYTAQFFLSDTSGNTNLTESVVFTVADTITPSVTIDSPTNSSFASPIVNFNATVLELLPDSGILQLTRSGESGINYTLTNNSGTWGYTNLSIPDGSYIAQFFVNDTSGNMNLTESVGFTIDTVIPTIIIDSPTNQTYNITTVDLNVSADETISSWVFEFNGNGTNHSFTPNTTLVISGGDGAKNLTVYATDLTGNQNLSTVYFTLDTTAPTITVDSPLNQTYATDTIDLNVSADEPINTWWFQLNGNGTNVTFTPNITLVGTEGNNNIIVYTNDSVGNEGSNIVYFTIDTAVPNVTIDLPLNITYDLPNITFNATVLEANPDSGILQVTPQGESAINYTLNNVSGNWGYTNLSMPDNTYTAEFYVNDTAGNVNNTESVVFTINTTPTDTSVPNVTIISPANTTFEARAIVNFNITVLEADPDSALLQLTRDGDSGINYSLTNNSGTWGYTNTSITLGTYTAEFYVNDTLGNINNTESVVFTVADTTVPNVTINTPTNTTSTSSTVNFNATVTELLPDTGILQLTRSGESGINYTLTNVSGNWGYTNLSIPDGSYIAQFFLNDTSGNTNLTESVGFSIDATNPSVTINSPTNTTFEGRTIINFNVTVLEDNPESGILQLTRDGDSAINYTLTNNSGNWGYTNTSIDLGTYTAQFFLNDTFGNNNNTESVVFTVSDTTVPNVTIDSPLNVTYDQSNVSFNATVTELFIDSGILQVTPDGQSAINYTLTNVSGNWGYTNLSMPDNTYTAQFFINDTSGNTNLTESVVFTIDVTNPMVTIDSPTNTTFEARAVINFNVTLLEDNPDVGLVQLTRDGDSGINYTLTNNSGNWGLTNTSVTLGTYTAEFYFNDTAGNINNTESVVFTVSDTTAPRVTIDSPTNTTLTSSTVNFNATVLEEFPADGILQVTPSGGSGINYTLTNVSGNWGYTNASMPDGAYIAQFFLNDTSGNMNLTQSVGFTVNITAPPPPAGNVTEDIYAFINNLDNRDYILFNVINDQYLFYINGTLAYCINLTGVC